MELLLALKDGIEHEVTDVVGVHALRRRTSLVYAYVVGESLDGPGPILRAPAGTYTGATNQATDGPSAAGRPIALAFSHGKGRVVIIGDAGIASAFGSVGGQTHRGISEADNALFVRNMFIRPEATGYGCVYFAQEMLKTRKETLEGKLCLVSGSGNVSQYTIEKLLDLGAKPITLSDSNGVIYDADSINREKLAWLMELKNVRRGRIREYTDKFKKAIYIPTDAKLEYNPLWNIKADCAFPSATQNEINAIDAANLIKNGVEASADRIASAADGQGPPSSGTEAKLD